MGRGPPPSRQIDRHGRTVAAHRHAGAAGGGLDLRVRLPERLDVRRHHDGRAGPSATLILAWKGRGVIVFPNISARQAAGRAHVALSLPVGSPATHSTSASDTF